MKKIKLFAFSILVGLFMTINVNAQEVGTISEFEECISIDENICTLTDDINIGEFTGARFVIDSGKTITIDLNGYTISGKNSNENVSTSIITNKGTLIINDSSTTKTGKIEMSDTEVRLNSYGYGMFAINNNATLTINGGTIVNTGKTDVPYAIDNNSTIGNTLLTVNGGKLVGRAAVRAFANSTTFTNDIIINDGHLEGTSTGIWLQQSNGNAQKASLTVNGGVIIGVNYPGVYADINNDKGSEVVSMTFNGGEIRNNSENYGAITFFPRTGSTLADATINLKITNALVINENSSLSALYFDSVDDINTDNIIITGGTYSSDVESYISEGLVSKKIGDNYVVGKEHEVNVDTTTNGTLLVDKTKAIAGENVTITTTPNEGYKLSILKVEDVNEEEIEVIDNKFVMPNGSVTITVSFVKTITDVEIPVLDTEEEVEEVIVGVTEDEETEDVLLESLEADEDLVDKIKNTDVSVGVEVEEVDETKLPEEVKEAIEDKAGDATIVEYFDISVVVRNKENLAEIDKIDELTKEIDLMILLPERLKNSDEEVNRKYYVIREHDGRVDKINATLSDDGKYLTFKSKHFSTYALAYEDIEIEQEEELPPINDDEEDKENNKNEDKKPDKENDKDEDSKDENEKVDSPQTGDNVITIIGIALISIIAFVGIMLSMKKRFN